MAPSSKAKKMKTKTKKAGIESKEMKAWGCFDCELLLLCGLSLFTTNY